MFMNNFFAPSLTALVEPQNSWLAIRRLPDAPRVSDDETISANLSPASKLRCDWIVDPVDGRLRMDWTQA